LTALIQSKILARHTTRISTITRIIDRLVDLALTKSWLREPSSKALCTLIAALPELSEGKSTAEYISKSLEEKGLVRSQDGAAVILTLRSLPKNLQPKISSKTWQHGDPLHHANISLLSKVLRDVPSEEDSLKATGSFKSEVHFIWRLILLQYIEHAKDIIQFKSLWEIVVESMIPPSSEQTVSYRDRWVILNFLVFGKKISWIPIIFDVSTTDSGGYGWFFIYSEFPSLPCQSFGLWRPILE
jgi:hypothetical protein